ncbi:hypothetical protein QU593_09875 [Rossellomorea marisflavi]|uniref:hypothetical protein n=1 Tax=Rossellomorea marisflavi TaxID=189381 RepID=UPI0025B12487|nr:hypothetical protein [Rossellomorea marisflavi]WJV20711.1 hypothetical protein QU593_09875 [Rossellomorea marisflavi]
MQKQIFYAYKFKSSRLSEFNYEIDKFTVDKARKSKELISMFDSQLLRSLRYLKNQEINTLDINRLKSEIKRIKSKNNSIHNRELIKSKQKEIDDLLFVPELITIVMESKKHYSYLFKHGLKLNNKVYRRLSCSAGQARASTVIFCEEEIGKQIDEIMDNGRDLNKKLVPSKYNAYKGLITSSTSVVTTPRFCLVPDYHSSTEVKVNFVNETDLNEDDFIEEKVITEEFNRFDGQGIVSIEMATQWAEDLGLDYIPAQWCFRQNYIKGMLTTFDIKAFCGEKNNKNYNIKTSYKDENGQNKIVDLRNIDVIISESQFKLWDSFSSIEEYRDNCEKNGLQWGISLISPKKDKDILKMNYQFLQSIFMSTSDIEKVSRRFVDWIVGVNSGNVYYTLLFLMGTDTNEDKLLNFLDESDKHWIKALMLNHSLFDDKWIKRKIYTLMKKKIRNGCLGQILVEGNFQVIVSDPFAQMQHVCNQTVTGLLREKEYYSGYWNKKGVKTVDSMRAPLTYRSEHVVLNLKKNEEMGEWYKYNNTGIIVNVHGHETMNWAGSDFDMDIIATTSDETIIKGVYRDELPVTYTPPNPEKVKLTERKLYQADLHSFGSEIGQITNKSTSGFALLAQLEEGTEEYNTTLSRIRMCTKLQSAQIDKAKIGKKVKSIPKIWLKYNKFLESDTPDIKNKKEFLNSVLLEKHPYFFTYLYKGTRRKYKNYFKNQDVTCRQKFGIGIDELKKLQRKTVDQIDFLTDFNRYSPVIDSDCVMNKLCRYIESIDFGIRNVVSNDHDEDYYQHLISKSEFEPDEAIYKKVKSAFKKYKDMSEELAKTTSQFRSPKESSDELIEMNVDLVYQELDKNLMSISSNLSEIVDHLVYMFYVDKAQSNKEVLWQLYGDVLYRNVRAKHSTVNLPLPDDSGDIEYLGKKYTVKEVLLDEQ